MSLDNKSAMELAAHLIEGFEGCKLTSYQDQRGIYTIGWGSTGPDIGVGLRWTQAQADERFQEDLDKFMHGVLELVKVSLAANQIAALTSFAYNIGLGNFARSGCLRFVNLEQFRVAMDNLQLWNKAGAYVSQGLVSRRSKERATFEGTTDV